MAPVSVFGLAAVTSEPVFEVSAVDPAPLIVVFVGTSTGFDVSTFENPASATVNDQLVFAGVVTSSQKFHVVAPVSPAPRTW